MFYTIFQTLLHQYMGTRALTPKALRSSANTTVYISEICFHVHNWKVFLCSLHLQKQLHAKGSIVTRLQRCTTCKC